MRATRSGCLAAATALCVSCLWAADLSAAKDAYQKASETIRLEYQPKFAELQQQYRQSLERLRAKVQDEGNLDKTKAALAEIARFRKANCLPAVLDGREIPEIKTLQDAYVKQFVGWGREMEERLNALTTKYTQTLDQMQKDLVRAGKLDEATAVQAERKQMRSVAARTAGGVDQSGGRSDWDMAGRQTSVEGEKVDAPIARDVRERQSACAKALGVPLEIVNSVGMRFELIPPGEFDMGSLPSVCQEEAKRMPPQVEKFYGSRLPPECPCHRVRITKPFYLGVCEVTQGDYERIMQANPSLFSSKARGRESRLVAGMITTQFPAENVTWDQAEEFAKRLSALPAEAQARRSYRLPTEAEWEYGCRAGTTARWYSGDDESGLLDCAWFKANAAGRPHPVGQKKPNAWGLCDMHGNVYEWCFDRYATNYYSQTEGVADPRGPEEGIYHVVRGGEYSRHPYGCRSAYRGVAGAPPWPLRAPIIGFRVCFSAGQ